MIEERVEVVIDVPVGVAFDFLSDPRSELAWNRFAVRSEKTSAGSNRNGSRHRGTYRGAGTFDLEVTEHEINSRSGYSGRSRWLAWDQTDEFEPLYMKTVKLKRWMAGYFKGPMRLLEPLMGGPFLATGNATASLSCEARKAAWPRTSPCGLIIAPSGANIATNPFMSCASFNARALRIQSCW